MTKDELRLDSARAFEWDPRKSAANIKKHGIDFDDAVQVFDGAYILLRSDRQKEDRWIAIGACEGRIAAVIFTMRGDRIRIISARAARQNEKRAYNHATTQRTPEG